MEATLIAGGAARRKTMKLVKYGSRRKVWNGSAEKTKGGLTRKDLKKNKYGRIVSVKRSMRGGAMVAEDEEKKDDE
jgi:hypothetical protein